MKNYMISMSWKSPEHGSYGFVANLTQDEWSTVRDALKWLENQANEEWGDSIPAFEITEAQEGLRGGYKFRQTMAELKTQSRYEEGVFEEKYGPFEVMR